MMLYMYSISNLNPILNPWFSPDMPESEATFAITAGGVADAKD